VFRQYVYATRAHVPDAVVQYAYDGAGQVDEGATTVWQILSDHLGSPRLVLPVGQVPGSPADRPVQCSSYSAFGVMTLDETDADHADPDDPPAVFVDPLPFGFAGGLYDRDTALVHFGAREYDPRDGRWTSKDPILFAAGDSNLYGYVLSDPVNLIDPTGEFIWVLVGAAALTGIGNALVTASNGGSVCDVALAFAIGAGAGALGALLVTPPGLTLLGNAGLGTVGAFGMSGAVTGALQTGGNLATGLTPYGGPGHAAGEMLLGTLAGVGGGALGGGAAAAGRAFVPSLAALTAGSLANAASSAHNDLLR